MESEAGAFPSAWGKRSDLVSCPCDCIRMICASIGGDPIAWVGSPLLVERHTIDQRKAPAEQAPKGELLVSLSVH